VGLSPMAPTQRAGGRRAGGRRAGVVRATGQWASRLGFGDSQNRMVEWAKIKSCLIL